MGARPARAAGRSAGAGDQRPGGVLRAVARAVRPGWHAGPRRAADLCLVDLDVEQAPDSNAALRQRPSPFAGMMLPGRTRHRGGWQPGLGDSCLKLLRFVLRLILVLPWIVFGLLCVGLVYPWLRPKSRAWLNRSWSRFLMAACGVRVVFRANRA